MEEAAAATPATTADGQKVTAEQYLMVLRERLTASYDIGAPRRLGAHESPMYARSQLVAEKYLLHRSISYERLEVNEHVLTRVLAEPVTADAVRSFVADLRHAVDELVKPSHEHMSSAITGALVAEQGFAPDAARAVTKSGFTRNFWFGLQGWCFLRLVGIDLATGETWANRRGKEVAKAYNPG